MRFLVFAALLWPIMAVGVDIPEDDYAEIDAWLEERCSDKDNREECRSQWHRYALKAHAMCSSVVERDLKNRWIHYDDFRIYRIGFSFGNTENARCMVSSNHANSDKERRIRVDVTRRDDRGRYELKPPRMGECRQFFETNC